MLKRYDINKKDLKLYPQYYNFIECENGRFYKVEDVEKIIIQLKDLAIKNKELKELYNSLDKSILKRKDK
jgi:hypothetical protein